MDTTRFLGTLALTLLVAAAGCNDTDEVDRDEEAAGATEQSVMPQPEMDPETMEQVMEIQEIQNQLQPAQQEALQDEELASRLEALQERIEAAMREQNPQAVERMNTLRDEMAAAQEAGDQERLQALMTEAQGIQEEVQALQASVLERPEIREQVEEFEAAYRERMIEIDPEAEPLLDRMDELIANLPQY